MEVSVCLAVCMCVCLPVCLSACVCVFARVTVRQPPCVIFICATSAVAAALVFAAVIVRLPALPLSYVHALPLLPPLLPPLLLVLPFCCLCCPQLFCPHLYCPWYPLFCLPCASVLPPFCLSSAPPLPLLWLYCLRSSLRILWLICCLPQLPLPALLCSASRPPQLVCLFCFKLICF